jgi:hypothetical protein
LSRLWASSPSAARQTGQAGGSPPRRLRDDRTPLTEGPLFRKAPGLPSPTAECRNASLASDRHGSHEKIQRRATRQKRPSRLRSRAGPPKGGGTAIRN